MKKYLQKKNVLDLPNKRSSHEIPTPKGGGIVIVVITLISLTAYQIYFDIQIYWSYLVGGCLVAIISFLDDLYELPALFRLICHMCAATLIIWQFGYMTSIFVPLLGSMNLGFIGLIFSILWLLWVTNAFNFMDGIDGIAALQSVIASIGWITIGLVADINAYVFIGGILASTCLGFLIYNWQPAKIFMGDVGSAFLGFTFGALPFFYLAEGGDERLMSYLPLLAILFIWLFILDTVLTFSKRLVNKEKVWQAHRQHIYQLLVRRGLSHKVVSKVYGFLSLLILVTAIFCLIIYKLELILVIVVSIISVLLFVLANNINTLTREN